MVYAAQWMPMQETPAQFEGRRYTILAWRQGHNRYLTRMAHHPETVGVPASKLRPAQRREPRNGSDKGE